MQTLSGSSYINLAKELNNSKKGLINIQNGDDSKYFKWYLIKYLHPVKELGKFIK